jgi:heat shock protein HtpX
LAIVYSEIGRNKRNTVFLITIFLVLVILLGWIFGQVFNLTWLLPMVVIIAVFQAFASYWWSDKLALATAGAHQIQKKDNPELYRVVENLTIAGGLPMPRVYIIDDAAPNAFATGRDPQHAAVAVTSGLLAKLEKSELEGVVAHEMSHIGNYDIRLMAVVVVLVGVVVMLSDFFLRFSFWGGMGGDDGGGDSDSGQLGVILMLVGIALAILSPIFASIIQLAVSRKREFLADADGALLSGYPEGLASALEKISKDTTPLKRANKATAHLYIASPLNDHKGTKRGWFAGLFDTHPPVEERIKRLRDINVKE